jgi:hypothetical protein
MVSRGEANRKYARHRVDTNHAAIKEAFRKLGRVVIDTSQSETMLDLLVYAPGERDRIWFVEVKNGRY